MKSSNPIFLNYKGQRFPYILYLLPGTIIEHEQGIKPLMARVLEAYQIPYLIDTDVKQATRVSRGNVNPSGNGCVALNTQTGKGLYDFLEFCLDIKSTQCIPCISINL
jgi:hypothetical protein